MPYRVGWARRRAGGAGDRVGQRTVLLGVECPRLLLLLVLLLLLLLWLRVARVLEGRDVEWWWRGHGVAGESWRPRLCGSVDRMFEGSVEGRTYQQVVSVSVGAVGEPSRLFVVEFTPGSSVGAVGITAIRVVEGEVRCATTDIWSEELGGTILELSA